MANQTSNYIPQEFIEQETKRYHQIVADLVSAAGAGDVVASQLLQRLDHVNGVMQSRTGKKLPKSLLSAMTLSKKN